MSRRRLVLIGAGHTHVLLLERWAADPIDADVVVVTCREQSTYSGMVPGVVAGDYRMSQAQIAVRPLAERAGAKALFRTATRIDPVRRTVALDDGTDAAYDLASLDVGSAVRGLDVPGVSGHAIATRPIDDLPQRLEEMLKGTAGSSRIVVVGGGAAGTELAFVLRARTAARSSGISLICGKAGLLPSYHERARMLARREAAARGIAIDEGADVDRVDAGSVTIGGRSMRADVVVWATGPASPAVVAGSSLPHDADGFVRVHATLQVSGFPDLFATGDCAAIDGADWVPKAGVHAVREAPVLDRNLRAALAGRALEPYQPQRDFLSLFNLGDGRALGTKWGIATSGRLAWWLKDRIDRAFVERLNGGTTR